MNAVAPDRLRLGRDSRLLQSRDFARLRSEGRRLTAGCLAANWHPAAPGGRSRLGVITSRKIGNAVARNRARRLLREAFRQHQHQLTVPVDLILVARQSIVGRRFAEVERDFLAAVRKAGLWKARLAQQPDAEAVSRRGPGVGGQVSSLSGVTGKMPVPLTSDSRGEAASSS